MFSASTSNEWAVESRFSTKRPSTSDDDIVYVVGAYFVFCATRVAVVVGDAANWLAPPPTAPATTPVTTAPAVTAATIDAPRRVRDPLLFAGSRASRNARAPDPTSTIVA